MSLEAEDEQRIISYLLDALPEADRERFEESYLLDDELFDTLVGLEEELIRDYLRGELPQEQRLRFENKYFNTPELKKKVDLARALTKATVHAGFTLPADSAPSPKESVQKWFRFHMRVLSFALAEVALLGCLSWSIVEFGRLRSKIGKLEQALLTQGAHTQTATFVLSPGGTLMGNDRGVRLDVPLGMGEIRLHADIATKLSAEGYRATLTTVENDVVWSANVPLASDTPSARRAVVVTIPAALIRSADYVLTLSALTPAGNYEPFESYSFAVVRR